MMTKKSQAYIAIDKHSHAIANGIIVCIDPSIGSTSSMPGYAVYKAGILQDAGIFTINPKESIPERLTMLSHYVRKLYKLWNPDILVFEEIPAQRYGGGNAVAHASLLKSVGVILSISGPDGYVGMLPISWKKLVRESYLKGDMEDAIEIGWIAIEHARQIEEEKAHKKEAAKAG